MIRDFIKEDKEELMKLAEAFYNSPAVDHPIPISHFSHCFDEIINGNLIDIQNRYKNKKTEIAKIEEMYNELKVELENEQTSLTV